MDGDPATFNGLAEEALACRKAGIAFEVVPGVSAVSAVPTYAGVPLTSSSVAGACTSSAADDRKVDWARSTGDHVTVVVLGAPETSAAPSATCWPPAAPATTPVALTERGTTIHQRTRTCTLGEVRR